MTKPAGPAKTLRTVSLAGMFAALALSAACGRVKVEGEAMAPALKHGDRVSVSANVDPIERGDIVVLKYPLDESKSFLKRIVGLPGEQIASADGRITVNGRPLDEPYVVDSNRAHDSWGPITMPPGQYFVLGDNRSNSSDSRTWGMVRRELITRRVTTK